VPLGERWQLVLFSDGLVEGLSGLADGERLGVEGLLRLIDEHSAHLDTGDLVDALIAEAARRHGEPLPDDVAVLVLERTS
jgi:serine phosphatase RsbU (regulator of sigma subunit)